MKKKLTIIKIIVYVLIFIIIFLGLFFTAVGIMFFTTAFKSKGNCNTNQIINIAHRGDTNVSQQNTIEAFISSSQKGLGAEFDIHMLKTGEFIIFHDDNAKELTGTDIDLKSASIEEIKQLKYKKVLNGKEYKKSPGIPTLEEALNAICSIDKRAPMEFDMKFLPNEDNMKKMLNILDKSPCSCDLDHRLYFSSPYFYVGSIIREALKYTRCSSGKVVTWFDPKTLPYGAYLWLKTRFSISDVNSDIIATHFKVWGLSENLGKALVSDGFCISIYGEVLDVLKKYYVTAYRVIDLDKASVISSEEDGGASFIAVIIFSLLGILIFVFGIIFFVMICCGCICTFNKDHVFYIIDNNVLDDNL